MIIKSRLIILLCLLLLNASDLCSQTVEVTVTGIRSDKGQIAIGLFLDDESFRREAAFLELQFPKKNIRDGVMAVSFSLEPGVYGLTLLDDEDNNQLMQYNFLGLPKEGFGFSGYYHTGITRPKFEDFRFTVVQDQEVKITVRMKYF